MPEYYETSDLNIGAFLIANKTPYRGCYIAPDGRTIFRFKNSDNITDLLDNYTFNFPVPVQSYVGGTKFLLGEVKKSRRNGGQQ